MSNFKNSEFVKVLDKIINDLSRVRREFPNKPQSSMHESKFIADIDAALLEIQKKVINEKQEQII